MYIHVTKHLFSSEIANPFDIFEVPCARTDRGVNAVRSSTEILIGTSVSAFIEAVKYQSY